MTRVIGIDPSTKTGIVILEDNDHKIELVNQEEIHFPRFKGIERVQSIGQRTAEIIEALKPDYAVIEGYGFANKHTLVVLVEIGTAIRLRLHDQMPGRWGSTAPNQLKKFATGEGQAKKDKVMLGVFKSWGFEGTDNECDAFALAALGLYAGCKNVAPKLGPIQRSTLQDWRITNRRMFD